MTADEQARSCYAVGLRFGGFDQFFVWYSGESDGVLLSSPDRISVFPTMLELERYAARQNLKLETESAPLYDCDRLARWLAEPSRERPDCPFLLDMWNMFNDVACSLGDSLAEPSGADKVYDKLFWGCNLPVVTPPGKHFEPCWSADDLSILSAVLAFGLKLLRAAVEDA